MERAKPSNIISLVQMFDILRTEYDVKYGKVLNIMKVDYVAKIFCFINDKVVKMDKIWVKQQTFGKKVANGVLRCFIIILFLHCMWP